jgi:hypothetical protein
LVVEPPPLPLLVGRGLTVMTFLAVVSLPALSALTTDTS